MYALTAHAAPAANAPVLACTALAAMAPAAKPKWEPSGAVTVTTSPDVSASALTAADAVASASPWLTGRPLRPSAPTDTLMASLGATYACTAATTSKSYWPSAVAAEARRVGWERCGARGGVGKLPAWQAGPPLLPLPPPRLLQHPVSVPRSPSHTALPPHPLR